MRKSSGYGAAAERMNARGPFLDRFILQNVLAENTVAALRRHFAVPDAFGIDQQPRSADADAKAAGLGSHDRQVKLPALPFQVLPGLLAIARIGAIGPEAKKEMASRAIDLRGVKPLGGRRIFPAHPKTVAEPRW
jgi:hypothetical protein